MIPVTLENFRPLVDDIGVILWAIIVAPVRKLTPDEIAKLVRPIWIEVVCAGDTLEYFVNGKLVNKASGLSNTNGKLMFQSEGAEIFFRRIELHPLPTTK